jgi:hypothetical protein
MISAMRYYLSRWWLSRQIALCHYRREELHAIMRRELAHIDYAEGRANVRLRELQSARMNERLARVGT